MKNGAAHRLAPKRRLPYPQRAAGQRWQRGNRRSSGRPGRSVSLSPRSAQACPHGHRPRSSSGNSQARRPAMRSRASVDPPAAIASASTSWMAGTSRFESVERNAPSGPLRVDARAIQRLADIDVAEARDDALVEQQQLDRRGPPGEPIASIRRASMSSGSGPSALKAATRPSSSVRTRSSEPNLRASFSASRRPSSVSMMKWSCLAISLGIDPPVAGHAEVKDERVAAIGIDQAIFRAAAKPGHPGAGQPLAEVLREAHGADPAAAPRPARCAGPSGRAPGRGRWSRLREARACEPRYGGGRATPLEARDP